jgi:hypothetical protein
MVASERWHSRLHYLLSKRGFVSFLLQMLRSLLLFLALKSALQRASTLTGRSLFCMIVGYVTYFHPCFMFEGMSVSLSVSCSFTLQLSFIAMPLAQSIQIFLIAIPLHIMGPLTFGISVWAAYVMRVLVFLAICGSGTTMAALPEL